MQVFSSEFEDHLGDLIEKLLREKLGKLIIKPELQVKEDDTLEDSIKISGAEKITGYKTTYIYELVRKKAIPYFKLEAGGLRFSRKELKDWLSAGRPNIHQEAIDNLATNYLVNGKIKK